MVGKHWAKVSKRGITERKRVQIEKSLPKCASTYQYDFTYLFSRKFFKRSRRSSDNELFLMRT